ncbi:hypothetical protein BpJC7_27770 [Weizmannia acidilactici]|uniref:Uncharacterized protein n=1 Tax=Weizmannia acidilactici TaxID=2607726 RepID=A0A5J4JQU4_9BACI|nr:hypothetical protein [Weizmannia acidilactici]GER68121.1 hypothetical protein BpJC4_25920 [Weizmannia acidilactici]GER71474.1 hypothetical protein BpJC7_27770 [Weizmannia acidilactici]GER74485.1 hypothetical protein BpPP18_25520 [Weizmannia acidilactici]
MSERMDMFFIPAKEGYIKIYVYGFLHDSSWGQVFTEYNGLTVVVKGYNRKKTIIRSLTKMHESLLKLKRDL